MDSSGIVFASVEKNKAEYTELGDGIWGYAETGFMEERSSKALSDALAARGFTIAKGIAGIGTAFSASWGQGKPVVAILGEFDALPGLSQVAGLPEKKELVPGANGHGCGHNLLGVGALAGAIAAKEYLETAGLPGTVRYFGCPGEEFGCGKTFMARAGVFADADAALCWHPMDINAVWQARTLANISVYFRFSGKASHAAASPHLGRSALDAVELTNVGANFLREHIIPEARLHYAITNPGGRAPNVVQAAAEVYYYCRAPRIAQAREIYERLCDVARGAALMTGTTLGIVLSQGLSDYVPNAALSELLQRCMEASGGPAFDDKDRELARKFRATLSPQEIGTTMGQLAFTQGAATVAAIGEDPLDAVIGPLFKGDVCLPGSTDVGDVSQLVPTGQFVCSAAAIGTQAHSWQNAAQVGSSIGHKGMLAAGRILGLAAAEIFANPEIVDRAKAELKAKVPPYVCPIPENITPEDVLSSAQRTNP